MKIKGQNLRIFIGEKCIAAATSCNIHIGTSLEDASTKDSTSDWDEEDLTGKSWDGSSDALVVIDPEDADGLQAFDAASMIGTIVSVKFCQTEGEKNRSKVISGKELSGSARITDFSLTAGKKANATYSVQFKGYGPLS